MNVLTITILTFSLLGAFDRIFNNRFGLGNEFEKGFILFGNKALSMIGMIIIAPLIADIFKPVFSFDMHQLRHTFCTLLYKSGVDMKTAQEILEHSDISITLKIYTHLDQELKSVSIEKLNNYVTDNSNFSQSKIS